MSLEAKAFTRHRGRAPAGAHTSKDKTKPHSTDRDHTRCVYLTVPGPDPSLDLSEIGSEPRVCGRPCGCPAPPPLPVLDARERAIAAAATRDNLIEK
eukprot:62562-Prymnesium_polylepis.1